MILSYNFRIPLLIVLLFSVNSILFGQDPTRFAAEVEKFNQESVDTISGRPILFVGSSSIRMWKSLSHDFPEHFTLNRGFGGSQMSDLVHYCEDLILQYQPKQIFIYEGDNDLSAGKPVEEIMGTTLLLVEKIRAKIADTQIVLIAAKPSLARWHIRDQYQKLNEAFATYATENKDVKYVDVWTPMLGDNTLVRSDLFIKDGLHMNAEGYRIWKRTIEPFLLR